MSEKRLLERDTRNLKQLQLPWSPGRTTSVAKVAQKLDCSEDTVRRMLESGELQGYQLRPGLARSPFRIYIDSVAKHLEKIARVNALEEFYE